MNNDKLAGFCQIISAIAIMLLGMLGIWLTNDVREIREQIRAAAPVVNADSPHVEAIAEAGGPCKCCQCEACQCNAIEREKAKHGTP